MPGAEGNRSRIASVLCVAAIGVGLAVFFTKVPLGWLDAYRGAFVSAIWVYLPLPFVLSTKKSPTEYGVSWGTGFRGLLEILAVSVAVTIPFYVAFFHFFPIKWSVSLSLPKDIAYIAVVQFLAIALPEEFFFRGFVQSELEGAARKKIKILGAELGWGWAITCLIFGVGHVIVQATPIRAAVIFPSLLFGWARVRTKSVLHPAIMHTLFNTTFIVAQKMAGF